MYSYRQWQEKANSFQYKRLNFAYWQGSANSPSQTKPVLLLIHGFPSASWDWTPLWEGLSQHYHLVAADMLGFGLSSKPLDGDYRIGSQADMFQALLKSLGIKRYSILAHDYGDTVAQELLARDLNDNTIEQAFLLNGGLFPETHRPLLAQKLMLTPIGALTGRVINYRLFEKSFNRICAKPLADDELQTLWQLLRFNQGQLVMHKLINYIRERKQQRTRWVGALQNTTTPLCLINGSLDPISGAHMVARYRQLVGTSAIVELADCGHYPQLEDPQAVLMAIMANRS